MMYFYLNTYFRKMIRAASIQYNGSTLPVHSQVDETTDKGAFISTMLYTNDPEYLEIGSYVDNQSRSNTGYFQIAVYLPAIDNGLDASMNKVKDDLDTAFKRQSISTNEMKLEILGHSIGNAVKINGHYVVTYRVNYRALQCIIA